MTDRRINVASGLLGGGLGPKNVPGNMSNGALALVVLGEDNEAPKAPKSEARRAENRGRRPRQGWGSWAPPARGSGGAL